MLLNYNFGPSVGKLCYDEKNLPSFFLFTSYILTKKLQIIYLFILKSINIIIKKMLLLGFMY